MNTNRSWYDMRHSTARVCLALGLLLLVADLFGQSQPPASYNVVAVESVGMTVSKMDQSVKFYTDVLGFEVLSDCQIAAADWEAFTGINKGNVRQVELKLGDEILQLTEYLDQKGQPMPADSRGHDHWFQHIAIIVSDMDKAYQRLREHKVKHASSGPQTLPEWNKGAAGIKAFYFRDPDGHFLEVLQFPPDKGDPKWQKPTDKLFLGIDHTAIVVSDTDASLKFYQGELGLRVAGSGENYGVEQEHLNGVFGARLRITTLRAESGPGVELLEYISPTDGRPAPAEVQTNDVMHWQVQLVSETPGSIAPCGSDQSVLVRDPNRHAMSLRTSR